MFGKLLLFIRQVLSNLVNSVDKKLDKEDIRLMNIVISSDALPPQKGVEPAAFTIGAVVKVPENPPLEISQYSRAGDLYEATLDSIYVAVMTLQQFMPVQEYPTIIEVPDRLIHDYLTGKQSTVSASPAIHRKTVMLLDILQSMVVPPTFIWKRRNSSPGLRRAIDLAQWAGGVKKRNQSKIRNLAK